jgi:hypothetical protein
LGVTKTAESAEFAETSPPPQPAASSAAEAKSNERFLKNGSRMIITLKSIIGLVVRKSSLLAVGTGEISQYKTF